MTRNQLLPNHVKNWSGGVMFTVDSHGNITPSSQQTVNRGETILIQADTSGTSTFSGKVCARQNDVCQCSTLVDDVSSGDHMSLGGSGHTVRSTVTVGSDYELYAVTIDGPVPDAINGDIHIGG